MQRRYAPLKSTASSTAAWGSITGTLSAQTDLQSVLDTFLTAEADTLASVTARGATTSVASSFTSGITVTATDAEVLSLTRSGSANLTIGNSGSGDISIEHSGTGSILIDGAVVSSTLIGQWNTAYGWGDHSLAGYLTSVPNQDIYASLSWPTYSYLDFDEYTLGSYATVLASIGSMVFALDTNNNGTTDFFRWYRDDANLASATQLMELDNSGNLSVLGAVTGSNLNVSNWDTAYTYSQVGHLPLAGGTVTGDLTGEAAITVGNQLARVRMAASADSGTRFYMVGRNSGDTNWEWTKEFGWNHTTQAWYCDSDLSVGGYISPTLGILGTNASDYNTALGSKPDGGCLPISSGFGATNAPSGANYWSGFELLHRIGGDYRQQVLWPTGTGVMATRYVAGGVFGAWQYFSSDATAATISGAKTFTANITARHIIPQADNSYDLGQSGTRWNQLWVNQIEFGGATDATLSRQSAGKLVCEGKALLGHAGAYTSGQITFSTAAASGGSNGDIWFQYT